MKYVLEINPQNCGKVFSKYGKVTTDVSILYKEPQNIALMVFTGGEDVYPELYGENTLWNTFCNPQRDEYEVKLFNIAEKHNIPKVGICRGSQFLCVMAGGRLIQDISGHGYNHTLRTSDGREMVCNSSHHQMQLPPEGSVTLAWCPERRSRKYLNGDGEEVQVDRECEVVHYPNINAVGIQYHPEWLNDSLPCVRYAKEVVEENLFSKVAA